LSAKRSCDWTNSSRFRVSESGQPGDDHSVQRALQPNGSRDHDQRASDPPVAARHVLHGSGPGELPSVDLAAAVRLGEVEDCRHQLRSWRFVRLLPDPQWQEFYFRPDPGHAEPGGVPGFLRYFRRHLGAGARGAACGRLSPRELLPGRNSRLRPELHRGESDCVRHPELARARVADGHDQRRNVLQFVERDQHAESVHLFRGAGRAEPL